MSPNICCATVRTFNQLTNEVCGLNRIRASRGMFIRSSGLRRPFRAMYYPQITYLLRALPLCRVVRQRQDVGVPKTI